MGAYYLPALQACRIRIATRQDCNSPCLPFAMIAIRLDCHLLRCPLVELASGERSLQRKAMAHLRNLVCRAQLEGGPPPLPRSVWPQSLLIHLFGESPDFDAWIQEYNNTLLAISSQVHSRIEGLLTRWPFKLLAAAAGSHSVDSAWCAAKRAAERGGRG